MLEMVQHASFLMLSLAEERRVSRQGKAPQLIITWTTICRY
jgi:hypothetical protein